MARRRVQFDMDGVLANFGQGYRALAAHLGQPVPGPEAGWDELWNEEVWARIKTSPHFWADLPPLVDPSTLMRIGDLTAEHDVYFVTNRPGYRVKYQTERWLYEHEIANATVIVTGAKAEFARAVHITHALDDKAGNAVMTQYWSPETASYLIDRPYNRFDQCVLGTKVRRIVTVEEFLEDL